MPPQVKPKAVQRLAMHNPTDDTDTNKPLPILLVRGPADETENLNAFTLQPTRRAARGLQ